jgi:hypothetical protein
MAKSKPSFNKKQLADKKRKKQKDKFQKKLEKKETPSESNWENLIMYVDADGNFSKTPPVKPPDEGLAPD